jgi:non-specific serine/threonine protein kinase
LFGPIEVHLASRPLPRLRSRKGLWLLALLALRSGREVDRDWLAATLWPDSDEAHGRRSLRQSLHDLRLALGPQANRLGGEGPATLRLDLHGAFVDALSFDAAVARGGPEALAEAVALHRGPLLEDCAEEWLLPERRAREQAYAAALESLAAAAASGQDPATAARYYQLAIAADPYREDLQRALMQALAESGSPSAALLVYRQFRALLWRELVAAPAEETTALFRQLQEQTRARTRPRTPRRLLAASGATASRPLPIPLTGLIGREADVREVQRRLASARLVTLTGTGGIGKTRLALHVAQEPGGRYPEGAWFVDLAALTEPALVPAAVAAALGIQEEPARPLKDTLVDWLASRALMLVLDNCEHLLQPCAALAEALLSRCPSLRILATSRQPLGLPGEVVWRVPSLQLPIASTQFPVRTAAPLTAEQWQQVTESPAVRLFVERARAAEARFEVTAHNAAAIAQVCRRLDGIPLAIELAAARVRAMSVAKIAARLHERFQLLGGADRHAQAPSRLPRHRTLRAAIDWSYELLSDAERTVMRRLAVFAGGWTLEAAEAVCGERVGSLRSGSDPASQVDPPPIHAAEVLDLIASLVEKSLVVYEEQDGEERYRLLETIREYFGERRDGDGEDAALRTRHLAYFLALVRTAERPLEGADQVAWLDRLEIEHDNMRAALSFGLDPAASSDLRIESAGLTHALVLNAGSSTITPSEAALWLAGVLLRFWQVRGYLTEGREWLAQALARAAPDAPGRAKALNAAGALAYWQADYRTARAHWEQGLALFRKQGDLRRAAGLLNNLGMVASEEGDFNAARAAYEESVAINRELGDRLGMGYSLHNLGTLASAQEEFAAARSLYEQSLAIYREAGVPWDTAASLQCLGWTAFEQGDLVAAHALHAESLSICRELGDRAMIAESLEALAALAREQAGNGAPERGVSVSRVVDAGRSSAAACRAARLLGAAEALREEVGVPVRTSEQEVYDRGVDRVRRLAGEAAFAAAWAEGRAMTLEQIIADALDESADAPPPPVPQLQSP